MGASPVKPVIVGGSECWADAPMDYRPGRH